MFEGNVLFAGVKNLRTKDGRAYAVIRFCDENTGDYCQMFVPEGVILPQGLKMFTKVTVKISPQGNRFVLNSVTVSK